MDEYRGRYDAYGRREPYTEPPPPPPPPYEEPPCPEEPPCDEEPGPGFDLGALLGGGLSAYFPILLVILGAIGLYLWVGRGSGGLGGLLGGILG